MIEFICWTMVYNIAYIVGLLMIEKIDILYHQYGGMTFTLKDRPLSKFDASFSKSLDEINPYKERRTNLIQKDLSIRLMQGPSDSVYTAFSSKMTRN